MVTLITPPNIGAPSTDTRKAVARRAGATLGDRMKTDLKNLLCELVKADYPTHRLANLARLEIETAWGDLSAPDIAELDAWLEAQQMARQGRDHVTWAYVRAALISVQQMQGTEAPLIRFVHRHRQFRQP